MIKKRKHMHINERISYTIVCFTTRIEKKTRCHSEFFVLAGFVISAICELERNAIQLALGSFYPTLLLSGTYKIKIFI